MKRGRLLLALGLVLGSARVCRADHHVWSYLIAKLAADGIHRATAVEVFDDARVPTFTGLQFAPDRPHEAGGIEPVQESNDGTPKDEKSDA